MHLWTFFLSILSVHLTISFVAQVLNQAFGSTVTQVSFAAHLPLSRIFSCAIFWELVLHFTCRLMIYFEGNFAKYLSLHISDFLCVCILTAFVEEATIVLILFHCLFSSPKAKSICALVYFWAPRSIPLIFFCVLSLAHTDALAVVLLSRSWTLNSTSSLTLCFFCNGIAILRFFSSSCIP